ncbi:MAG: nucleotidyl transferase AbiEii/AbiGii toxin family protein, partial [Desulfovibrionaceae bacterium]|nr:nucleotidyl transferase AbiEii/AbiGii toxin family protein [Desulfovibrionaceae bacterium]
MEPKLSILSEAQRQIWPMLAKTKECGLVLYGGTALTLRLGHRESVDFDFFSSEKFEYQNSKLFKLIPFINKSKIMQEGENTLTFETENKVKISFFGNINFGCINYPDLTSDNNIYIASILDIMATKLKTLLQRVAIKDYLDIAEIIKHGVKLEKGLSAALGLFKNHFPTLEALRALTYFNLKSLQSLPDECKNILIKASRNVDLESISPLPIISRNLLGK